jgi:hypothetical protein
VAVLSFSRVLKMKNSLHYSDSKNVLVSSNSNLQIITNTMQQKVKKEYHRGQDSNPHDAQP